jgi:RNA polymerase sigma-70 factor, ECF subfamily
MSHLRLVSSRPEPDPTVQQARSSHPCLDAFQLEFDYLTRTLRRLGVQRDDLEDLAHEVFLVLHRTWDNYDPSRPLRPYLFGIAFRIASAHHRKRQRELPYAMVEVEDLGPQPEQALQSKQARALVLKALERIVLPRRAVLIMHDIDEVPMRELASTLSIHLFTAYSRLRKARKEFAAAVTYLCRASDP